MTLLPLRLAALLSVLLLAAGCDSDVLSSAGAPTVSYASTTLDADFYRAGASGSPSVDWNGAQGSISLGTDVPGLSINATTGRLSWTKLLPPSTHDVEVVFSNSEGQVVVPLTIENRLSGSFEGVYDGNTYYALDVAEDGTVVVRANSSANPDRGQGTWRVATDGSFVFDYTYDGDTSTYHVVADLVQTDAEATLSGSWFFGGSGDSGASRGGSVSVTLG